MALGDDAHAEHSTTLAPSDGGKGSTDASPPPAQVAVCCSQLLQRSKQSQEPDCNNMPLWCCTYRVSMAIQAMLRRYFEDYLPGPKRTVFHTQGGLSWRNPWGVLRYSANNAFLALVHSQQVFEQVGPESQLACSRPSLLAQARPCLH